MLYSLKYITFSKILVLTLLIPHHSNGILTFLLEATNYNNELK